MFKEIKVQIKATCNSCKHLDFYEDDIEDYPICRLSGNEVDVDDNCELYEFDKMLVKDTFWISKIIKEC